MNEKNLTEIDSDKENANPIAENAEDNIVEEEATVNVAEDTLENADDFEIFIKKTVTGIFR